MTFWTFYDYLLGNIPQRLGDLHKRYKIIWRVLCVCVCVFINFKIVFSHNAWYLVIDVLWKVCRFGGYGRWKVVRYSVCKTCTWCAKSLNLVWSCFWSHLYIMLLYSSFFIRRFLHTGTVEIHVEKPETNDNPVEG